MGGTASIEAWSDYWRAGALHSLGTGTENVTGAIRARWLAWLSMIEREGAVLDLGAGNGPLARFALGLDGGTASPGRVVHAFDIARTAPLWLDELSAERRNELVWHAGCGLESMPLVDGGAVAAMSQYGLEYADLPRAVPELCRVLRPGGAFAFLVHHADSLIVRRGRAEATALRACLDDEGLLGLAARMEAVMARRAMHPSARPSPDDEQLRRRYNALQAELDEWEARDEFAMPALAEVRAAVHGALRSVGKDGDGTRIARVRRSFGATLQRLMDLEAAALNYAGSARLVGLLAESGARTEVCERFESADGLLGWWVAGRR